MNPNSPGFPKHSRERGSVLIVALLFAAAIAVSIGSYMALATTSLKTANRSFYMNAALNLAETGVEEALWCFNQMHAGVAVNTAWTGAGWTTTAATGVDAPATQTFSGFTFAAGTTGSVKVYVDHANPGALVAPKVLALATISIPNQTPIIKEIEVTLSKRSYFAMGMVAENTINFDGNCFVDSWNSKFDDSNNPRAPHRAYHAPFAERDAQNYARPRDQVTGPNANALGSIGAGATVGVVIGVGSADIYGTASVGSTDPATAIQTGNAGSVGAPPDADGEDPAAISGGFQPQLEVPDTPTISNVWTVGATIGDGSTISYRTTGTISTMLTVSGNVTLHIDVPVGTNAINLTGGDDITIPVGSSLIIYTPGNIKADGNAIINNQNAQPLAFQLYGTSTTTQTIDVGGSTVFKGCIYAPNAAIKLHGTTGFEGSVVGETIRVTGNSAFHYDESLAGFTDNVPYGPSNWRELTSASDRAAVASLLNF